MLFKSIPELPLINMKDHAIAWIGRPYKILCNVESLVPGTIKWYKNNRLLGNPINFK